MLTLGGCSVILLHSDTNSKHHEQRGAGCVLPSPWKVIRATGIATTKRPGMRGISLNEDGEAAVIEGLSWVITARCPDDHPPDLWKRMQDEADALLAVLTRRPETYDADA